MRAVGSFMVAAPAQADPACQNYEFPAGTDVVIRQSDDWKVSIPASGQRLTGTVFAAGTHREEVFGSPSGGINGTTIDFTRRADP